MLLVAGLGAPPVLGVSPEPSPSAFEATVRHVSGGSEPSTADLHQVWEPIMSASALDRMHSYVAPASVVGYAGGEVPETPCALATNVRFWRANARYCVQDATIWYDATWLRELAERFGAFAPAAVLAHEWGHHVQTFGPPVPPGLRAELQADCFAGMYLGETEGLEPGGSYTVRYDDLRTALFAFFSLGDTDYRHSQWFQPGLHGSPQQRILAFTTGYIAKSLDRGTLRDVVNALDWCLGYGDFEPGTFVDIGPYRLLGPPGRPGVWTDGAYVIWPRPDPAFPSSELRLRWFSASEPVERATQGWLADRLGAWLPGASISPLGTLAVRSGTGVASSFEGQYEKGIAALAVPVSGEGGLLIVASRPRPAPSPAEATADLATFMEQATAVNEIVTRLCAPGESPDPTVANHNAVCMPDVQ